MNNRQKTEPPHAAHALTREVPLIGTVRIVERGGSVIRLDLGSTAFTSGSKGALPPRSSCTICCPRSMIRTVPMGESWRVRANPA